MNIIYWNTNKTETLDRVIDIIDTKNPDIVFLSEINKKIIEGEYERLKNCGYEYFENPGCNRVAIIKKHTFKVELKQQSNYFTVIHEVISETYIVSIHLPSQMFQHMKALKEFIREFRQTLDIEVGSSLEKKIIVIGDFNINPHEEGMIDFDGFLATNSTSSRDTITHLQKKRTTYYNPTWLLYSRKQFPGTKSFQRPSGSSYDVIEHHYLDQVVISKKLLKCILEDHIEIIEQTNNFSFFDKEKNLILGSDHLPLLYQFKY